MDERELELERVVVARRREMNPRDARATVEFPRRVGRASAHCVRTHDTTDTTVSRVTIGGRVGGLGTRGRCLE
jgi:hypothetical protein